MWLAREKSNYLYLFVDKPFYISDADEWMADDWTQLDNKWYPEVTVENSPVEVELKLKL